ncbi:MAG: ABC transporter ATP-binding protein [Chloroflexi bacterium]|nr:ABC transporter ATP-binding protein [Chloroflexota bacterium]
MQDQDFIIVNDVKRYYKIGDEIVHALDGVSLKIPSGQFVALLGPSGSGKSTLLNMIGGLDTPNEGHITISGQDLSEASDKVLSSYRNSSVGFVFQAFNLLPSYTAQENVAVPLIFSRMGKKERLERAKDALEAVHMPHRMTHRPNELSGGERQRVSIARALVVNPKIIIADEPTGSLDTKTGNHIMDLLQELNEKKHITLVIATHDLSVAQRVQRIIRLTDGKIVEDYMNDNNQTVGAK